MAARILTFVLFGLHHVNQQCVLARLIFDESLLFSSYMFPLAIVHRLAFSRAARIYF
jgi:hypothetical protein